MSDSDSEYEAPAAASSSSSSSVLESYSSLPLSSNGAYAGVCSIAQDDGPYPICAITYTPVFTEVMSYFRAILQQHEVSLRALVLTQLVIQQNSANYTAWGYRRTIFEQMYQAINQQQQQHTTSTTTTTPSSAANTESTPPSLSVATEFFAHWNYLKELEFCSEIARDSPKNYQLWHHKRCIFFALLKHVQGLQSKDKQENKDNDKHHDDNNNNNNNTHMHNTFISQGELDKILEEEFALIEEILADDNKNYHVWSHRVWLVRTFQIWNKELKYTTEMIDTDIRNNSAWNHRFFTLVHSPTGILSILTNSATASSSSSSTSTPSVDVTLPLSYSQINSLSISTLSDGQISSYLLLVCSELSYIFQIIETAPHNESVWNYLHGLLFFKQAFLFRSKEIFQFLTNKKENITSAIISQLKELEISEDERVESLKILEEEQQKSFSPSSLFPEVTNMSQFFNTIIVEDETDQQHTLQVVAPAAIWNHIIYRYVIRQVLNISKYKDLACRFVYSLLVDLIEMTEEVDKAILCCTVLSECYDIIRAKYWEHRRAEILARKLEKEKLSS